MKKVTFLTILVIASIVTLSFTINLSNDNNNSIKQSKGVGIQIGQVMPDLILKDVNGKESKISDLRGKVVLVDFWASWCGPCRKENPNVVNAYNKYSKAEFKNAKGFEIYSISLDRDKDAWLKAITTDKLRWKHHVSDLGAWNSKAVKKYNINSIPASFLLDKNGKILTKNLRGARLHQELDKLVKSL